MPAPVPSLSAELLARVCEVVDRFDAAWQEVAKGAARPSLEDALRDVPAEDQLAYFRELLAVELECRQRFGEQPTAEVYHQRFPELGELIELAFSESGQTVVDGSSKRRRSWQVRLSCPHCHNPIELVVESVDEDVMCPSCGSALHIDAQRSMTWNKQKLPQIAQFELLEQVGRGAFGSVYKALDRELRRTVAIKVPRSGVLATDEDEDRFVREARNVAQLRHPGIVAIHSVGRSETFPYLVSEFVEGVTLSQHLTAKRFNLRAAVTLVRDMALALQHAHEHGVVHRDLKPSNVMLTPDGTPRIMDFGFAKRDAGEVTMTLDGQILGTPAYMSPEQARGQSHEADARSDIYSLGVMLFQLLTGELPFRGDVRMLLHQVVHDEAPSPRTLNHQVPRDVATITLKCLSKDPKRRYATAAELADDLTRWLDGRPIVARPVSRTERAWRWCRRNPTVATLSGTAGLLLMLVAVLSLVAYFREARFAEESARLARKEQTLRTQASQLAADNAQLAERATEKANDAERERQRAEASELETKRQLYSARMPVIAAEWGESGDIHRLQAALDEFQPQPGESDLRDFEWYALNQQIRGAELSIGSAEFRCDNAVFVDDTTIAVAGKGHVSLYDRRTGHVQHTVASDPAWVYRLRPSLEGGPFVIGWNLYAVHVWRLDGRTLRLLRAIPIDTDRMLQVELSRNGRWLLTREGDVNFGWRLRCRNVDTGEEQVLLQTLEPIRSATLALDGLWVSYMAGETDRQSEVRILELATGRPIAVCTGHTDTIWYQTCSPIGTMLASSSFDGTIQLWRTADWKAHRKIDLLSAYMDGYKRQYDVC